MAKYTMKQILESYTPEKRKESSIWARIFSRPLSFLLTYCFINIGCSANFVSVISMFEALAACLLIILGGKVLPVGVAMFVLWHVLDCCDGNIARIKGTSSYAGEFFDAVSGYIAPAFIFLSVGVAAYHTTSISAEIKYVFIIFGAVASISDILSRMIYQKYLVTEYRLNLISQQGNIDEERASGIRHIADIIMKNLAYSSLFMPLLIISCIFKKYDILITLYGIYSFTVLIITAVFFVKKGATLNQRVKEQRENKKYKVGFTAGVFDMFHVGHLNLINNAAKYCDNLIVGVNSDELVMEYKHKKPVIPLEMRLDIVNAIKGVNKTVRVDTLDKVVLYDKMGFDVVFIGDDWKGTERWNKTEKELKERGVDVVYLPYTKYISSTIIKQQL